MFIKKINIKYLSFSLLVYFIYNAYVYNTIKLQKCFNYEHKKGNFLVSSLVLDGKDIKGRRNKGIINFIRSNIITTNKFKFIKKKNVHKHKNFLLKSRKCDGYRNTKEGKEETIRKIKRILKVTKLLIQLNSFKLSPNLRMDLLINMPRPHVRMHMVKNTLMKLSVKNTPFEAITPYLKESNVYLFIMNENYISFTLYRNKMFSSLYKDYKLNNFIKVSVYENTILDKKETEDLINLKSHKVYFGHVVNKINNIITSIPNSILQIPSSIARGIYLNTQKNQ